MAQGAALGAAFELLFVSVADATKNIAHFNADLNRLESTLCSIRLAVGDIENINKILKGRRHETQSLIDRLLEGEKLIQKCSRVKWNVFKRLYYSKKLRKLEALLLIFFQIDVATFIYRESKKI
ncbi:hypothetical protein CDL12_02844 [Handroanthus impetiginosus]|uniref:RPW8 domain-containing protein n=1 Tax=Handroanthus impetiginosus TaxID=429701 RepID=A0A2G9I3U2_9LAMI|nr:hypothetical protein CDL12_02844 [Handroanthus impetiginosus]